MRILHVDSARGWRGGQNQVLLTARGMADRGHEVVLACQADGALASRARDAGLDLRLVSFQGDFSPAATLALYRLTRAFKPHVMQFHDPHAIAAGALVPGTVANESRAVGTRRVDFPIRGFLSRTKYRSCDRIVVVSQAIRNVLMSGGFEAERLRVVYEGIVDRPILPGGREALSRLGVPPDVPLVGNVAALTDHKDHATLLRSVAHVLTHVPGAHFVIVGDGELRGELERLADSLGIGRQVVFAGFRTDVDCLLPAFDVFCLSSHMEGLGTSLFDAMCFGRAIVATAAGGIPEVVEDGVTGRVVPIRDPAALAAAIVELLTDPDRRRAMGIAGRRRFQERFTAERMVDETLRVYAEIV